MENATKALLIAAAVLVAIIVISLTLGIVRQGQETISSADMSQAEMDAHNAKFTMYEGNHVSTAEINALLRTVVTHNHNVSLQEKGMNHIVYTRGIRGASYDYMEVTGSSYYTVKCEYKNGIVKEIYITEN